MPVKPDAEPARLEQRHADDPVGVQRCVLDREPAAHRQTDDAEPLQAEPAEPFVQDAPQPLVPERTTPRTRTAVAGQVDRVDAKLRGEVAEHLVPRETRLVIHRTVQQHHVRTPLRTGRVHRQAPVLDAEDPVLNSGRPLDPAGVLTHASPLVEAHRSEARGAILAG